MNLNRISNEKFPNKSIQKIDERHMGSLGDGYEKTYEALIPNFAPIKKFDIYDKNYSD